MCVFNVSKEAIKYIISLCVSFGALTELHCCVQRGDEANKVNSDRQKECLWLMNGDELIASKKFTLVYYRLLPQLRGESCRSFCLSPPPAGFVRVLTSRPDLNESVMRMGLMLHIFLAKDQTYRSNILKKKEVFSSHASAIINVTYAAVNSCHI